MLYIETTFRYRRNLFLKLFALKMHHTLAMKKSFSSVDKFKTCVLSFRKIDCIGLYSEITRANQNSKKRAFCRALNSECYL